MSTLTEYVLAVEHYEELLTTSADMNEDSFLYRTLDSLLDLYRLGHDFPDRELPDDWESCNEGWDQRDIGLEDLAIPDIGEDFYRFVFHPFSDDDVVGTTIAEDLVEIYNDLISPLPLYRSGEPGRVAVAVTHWEESMRSEAGRRILNVLQPLHVLVNGLRDLTEQGNDG